MRNSVVCLYDWSDMKQLYTVLRVSIGISVLVGLIVIMTDHYGILL